MHFSRKYLRQQPTLTRATSADMSGVCFLSALQPFRSLRRKIECIKIDKTNPKVWKFLPAGRVKSKDWNGSSDKTPTMARSEVLCYNRGCGQRFDPANNNEGSCQHHPGAPYFHETYKGWSCCGKKSVDFTEFLNVPGCAKGLHSTVKPEEPESVSGKKDPRSLQQQLSDFNGIIWGSRLSGRLRALGLGSTGRCCCRRLLR